MAGKLKVGVIGVGGIATTHMPGWMDSPYTEVVAGCDVAEGALQTWGSKYGVEKLTTRADDLLNDHLYPRCDEPTDHKNHYCENEVGNEIHNTPKQIIEALLEDRCP